MILSVAQGYWTTLGASFRFSDDKVKENLHAIHQDVVEIWNFNDPDMVRTASLHAMVLDGTKGPTR